MDNVFSGILKVYDDFRDDGQAITINYDLKNPNEDIISKYKIDRIAGDGTDFERSIRLLNWLCDHVYHYGYYDNHVGRDGLKLLDYAFDKGENRGINCRALSIILTECLLSVGIKARTVSMVPLSPYDGDNHVICEFYDEVRSKWVMIDPTFNLYLTDKDNNPLSILEIRNILADRKDVFLSKEANYNGKEVEVDEITTYYGKNMFSLEVYEHQGRCSEELDNNRLINIVPKGFDVPKRKAANIEYRVREFDNSSLKDKFMKIEAATKRVYRDMSVLY